MPSKAETQEASMADGEQKDTYGSLGGEPITLKELVDRTVEQLEKSVRERPLTAVGIALAAGFLLASIRRR
jgi:ElaB/YqjD/DUF883 family membrane-anchored ribosome-binding protein